MLSIIAQDCAVLPSSRMSYILVRLCVHVSALLWGLVQSHLLGDANICQPCVIMVMSIIRQFAGIKLPCRQDTLWTLSSNIHVRKHYIHRILTCNNRVVPCCCATDMTGTKASPVVMQVLQ